MLKPVLNYCNNNLGSKRGALKYFFYNLKLRLGGYRACRNIDFSRVQRLVFICSGNICRSSFGEYAAKSLNCATVSYGLHCSDGHMADARAIAYAETCGIDMLGHRTQNIRHYDYDPGDLVVGMEPKHLSELVGLLPEGAMITSLALWGKPTSVYLHDPYCSNASYFKYCEHRVFLAVEELVKNARNAG